MKLKTLIIKKPIYVKNNRAYFAISDWNFDQLCTKSGQLHVEVYWNGEYQGYNIVQRGKWKRDHLHKESVVKLEPDDPMIFYYGIMALIPPPSKMSDREFSETFL